MKERGSQLLRSKKGGSVPTKSPFLCLTVPLMTHSSKSLNSTGRVNIARMGLPASLPGTHFGINLTTLAASFPRPFEMSCLMSTLLMEPSFSTMNVI